MTRTAARQDNSRAGVGPRLDGPLLSVHDLVVRFRTAVSEIELGKLLALLIEEGIPVTQFREVQTDLEEAYMSFAGPSQPQPVAEKIAAHA